METLQWAAPQALDSMAGLEAASSTLGPCWLLTAVNRPASWLLPQPLAHRLAMRADVC